MSSGVYHPQDYHGPICPIVGHWAKVWQLSLSLSVVMRIRQRHSKECDDEKFQYSRRHTEISAIIKNNINAKTTKLLCKLKMNNHSPTWRLWETLRYNLLDCVTWRMLSRSSLRLQYINSGAIFTADYDWELKASKITFSLELHIIKTASAGSFFWLVKSSVRDWFPVVPGSE